MKKRETHHGLDIELEDGDLPDAAYTHRLPVGKRARGWTDGPEIEISRAAVEILGSHGRLVGASKSGYRRAHPDHEVYFNACIFVRPPERSGMFGRLLSLLVRRFRRAPDALEIWFGDLDLTKDRPKLQELADRVGEIIVTREHPYRFEGLGRGFDEDPEIRVFRPSS